ncbi:hypothetical protein H6S82_16125 [Planktothrix sp. FACHB-1355]|uniref:Uncharacterized protein n=1 Tax=Aerosakkonema funiforme FACHB-1375 TaxID=2949571 RepID=A0A926VGN7_9CYAN|nr:MULTISPECIES: hypothetical protein [Oscillatoriales]MBD2182793.1 hypothetical protein [Aerosakkonema funiforme FACHB-1375]MBD3560368.1 hypothetical protein [Planktothrix sp. FACHB-1355]
MSTTILDTVVLRVMSFAHPRGIDILLETLNISSARFPAEVYNRDENSRPLEEEDEGLSELAIGLRYAQRQSQQLPLAEAQRYHIRLRNAQQLPRHFKQGSLIVETLTVEELDDREILQKKYLKCHKGEAACLVLAKRYQGQAVFLSSDDGACKVAKDLGIPYLTLEDILQAWVEQKQPTSEEFDRLVNGMKNAAYNPKAFLEELRRKLQR